jgi:hypothetical protein
MPSPGTSSVLSEDTGSSPEVTPTLEVTNRTINSVDQAFSVCETLVNDWKEGISKSARITRKLNGERPYNQKKLEQAGKGWKTNISTGFLATECSKVLPRFYMPIKTAKYLTAAELPPNWPEGTAKTQHFRQVITDTVRAWPKLNFYIRGLAREVGIFGFAFNCFFDEYEWRPTLLRMDRGFVPQGTEILEEPTFFMAKYDYKPAELLDLLKASVIEGRTEWKQDNVVAALNAALPPNVDSSQQDSRSYEELIRQSTWGHSYTKGAKVVRTWHLFAKEATGTVSHYVILAENPGSGKSERPDGDARCLYENLDQFASMDDAVNTMVFDYGDGTVHGSWGAGQILYDLAVQVEKVRCDSIDNIRLTNKAKIQVPDAKNVNDVKMLVNDQFVIVSSGTFAGNSAGLTSDVEGYELLDQKLTMLAQQKIGAFVPPIPVQPSDIKAAQINAAMSKERELQEALLENWLIQFAQVIKTITKRLCNPGSPDPIAQETIAKLLEKLTPEEIMLMTNQFPVKSVIDFTEFKAQQRGTFASTVMNNPLFRQSVVARIMAEGAGDETFVSAITIPEGDESDQLAAQSKQTMENTTLFAGKPLPVLPTDNDWVHMQTLEPELGTVLSNPEFDPAKATIALQHYAGHWSQGVNKKTLPKESINEKKQWIATAEKVIGARQEQMAIQQQAQQAQQAAEAEAMQMVQGEMGGGMPPEGLMQGGGGMM